jgi:hypothetical protein
LSDENRSALYASSAARVAGKFGALLSKAQSEICRKHHEARWGDASISRDERSSKRIISNCAANYNYYLSAKQEGQVPFALKVMVKFRSRAAPPRLTDGG